MLSHSISRLALTLQSFWETDRKCQIRTTTVVLADGDRSPRIPVDKSLYHQLFIACQKPREFRASKSLCCGWRIWSKAACENDILPAQLWKPLIWPGESLPAVPKTIGWPSLQVVEISGTVSPDFPVPESGGYGRDAQRLARIRGARARAAATASFPVYLTLNLNSGGSHCDVNCAITPLT